MKKGFTLIELLAVIVILAIIALIVTPVVSNIVVNARIAANARSVEGHIRNIELAIISRAFASQTTGDTDAFDDITEGTIIESSLSKPDNDNVTCTSYKIEHGKVVTASGCKASDNSWDKKYSYSASNGAYVFEFNGTFVAAGSGETHKGIVYMDPTNVKIVCNQNSTIDSSSNTGCKKFYIYDDSGDTYKMINDRNLGDNIKWNSSGRNASMSTAFTTAIADRTAGWNTSGNVRLITANEIAAIVEKENWSSSTATISKFFYFGSKSTTDYSSQTDEEKTVQQSYHWLFDYTNSCTLYGCNTANSSTYGYWTSSAVSGSPYNVWYVYNYGNLSSNNANNTYCGIRPVLEIPKSLIG